MLHDLLYRLENLYKIRNKDGEVIPFVLNNAQRSFLLDYEDHYHFKSIILKARQLGFSTLIQLMMLDQALFYPNTNAGIIAQTAGDGANLFSEKILFAYDNLPQIIKDRIPFVKRNTEEIVFANGSKIVVGVSLRSGTYQFIHISEFGKIAATNPHRAKEIISGALNTISNDGLVFIESTAEGQEGRFYDMVQKARSKNRMKRKHSPAEFKFHFYPWFGDPGYTLPAGSIPITQTLDKYFNDLQEEHGICLSDEQKAWYAAKYEEQGDSMTAEFPSHPDEAFAAAIEGAYYDSQMTAAEKSGRVGLVLYDPKFPVETAWDIGFSDDTSIVFYQRVKNGVIHVIDFYSNSSQPFEHYAQVLEKKGYRYSRHILPHDVRHHEIGSGLTKKETLENLGVRPIKIAMEVPRQQGIENVRMMLPMCVFDEAKTAELRVHLKNYRRDFNVRIGGFTDKPRHDEHSHAADAVRYMACAPKILDGQATPLHIRNFGAV